MNGFKQDLRFALRALQRSRLVTVVAVVSLALAIAANVTVFSVINGLFFRPLPYKSPDRLVLIGERYRGQADVFSTASAANLLDWSAESRVFQEMAAFKSGRLSLTRGERTEPVSVAMVSPSFFRVLGRDVLRGRTFTAREGTPGGPRAALLSEAFWESRFGAEESLIGGGLKLDGETYTVVGILPRDFEFLIPGVQIWLPLVLDSAKARREEKDLLVVARLKPTVSTEQAKSEMEALGERLAARYPDGNRDYRVAVVNLREEIPDERNRRTFGLLQGAMFFVLLIACANLANMLMARSRDRLRELAVYSALGASRWRIARQLLFESLLLAALASTLGLTIAVALVRIIATMMASSLPEYYAPTIDLNVIAFTVLLGAASGLLFGVAPALVSRLASYEVLKEAAPGQGARPGRRFLANALVAAEIATSAVLLAGAGMLIQGFRELQNADPGFKMNRLLTVGMTLPAENQETPEQELSTVALLERLANVPGVESASLTNSPPRSPSNPTAPFSIARMEPSHHPRAILLITSPSYLATLQIPLIRGRYFTAADREGALPVAAISQGMAQRYWPDREPVGEYLTIQGVKREIVGVVGDVKQEIALGGDTDKLIVYLPVAQQPARNLTAILRTSVDPHQVARPVREAIAGLNREITVSSLLTMEEHIAQFLVGARVFALLLAGFGSFALLLAAIGTYGVLAYAVAQRTHEIGVRLALGARRGQILRMIAARGLRLAVVGFLIAVPGIIGLSRLIASVLAGLTVVQMSSLLVAGLVLLAAILLACIAPARRASAVDPVTALRSN